MAHCLVEKLLFDKNYCLGDHQVKDERLLDFCYGCGRIDHVIKECKDTVIDAEQDHKGRQYGSWLRLFQGLNPRRRRKASPQKNEKEKPPFESSAIKTGGFSLNERVAKSTENSPLGSNNKGKEDEEISNRQAPSPI